ncbi:ester cyclase [Segeticoccus rhizosphaerae]|jgi:predicted ester cyclase|uniref:ester cyclase n=1 Tax=Segeticoccus rhizosphaerae TaxID=1104777 RepID=UPI0012647A4B|nr:nuclear transport factor 2 family protein [Segeticoccus rhizosphaerae]
MPDLTLGVSADPVALAVRSIHAMASGDREEFDALYHPDARDRENRIQPPASRVPGPDCFWSTARWLRAAFAGLHYEIHHALADGDLVAVDSTMCGTHTAPWAVYTDDGDIDSVFPPTGKPFRATQTHWFRVEDDLIREHWANRDDLGMAQQLGWIPPTPIFLLRMGAAKRHAHRSERHPAG